MTWSIVLSVLMIAAGVLAMAAPMVAGVAVTAVVAWLLILSGMLHFAFAWRSDRAGAVLWEVMLGIVYGAIGFYLLWRPVSGLESLTLATALYLLIEGAIELVLGFQTRPLPGSGWLFFDGFVTLILAALIASSWPSSAAWAVGTLVGISMLFSGVTRLMLSIALRSVIDTRG